MFRTTPKTNCACKCPRTYFFCECLVISRTKLQISWCRAWFMASVSFGMARSTRSTRSTTKHWGIRHTPTIFWEWEPKNTNETNGCYLMWHASHDDIIYMSIENALPKSTQWHPLTTWLSCFRQLLADVTILAGGSSKPSNMRNAQCSNIDITAAVRQSCPSFNLGTMLQMFLERTGISTTNRNIWCKSPTWESYGGKLLRTRWASQLVGFEPH